MSNELTPYDEVADRAGLHEQLSARSRHELIEGNINWFVTATDMRDQRDELAFDLEAALNFCRSYQNAMTALDVPDPNMVPLRTLLRKYGMDFDKQPHQSSRIFVDGVDITEHPDSIPGDAEELHLTAAEYYGTETVELVQLQDGSLKFLPVDDPEVIDTEWSPEETLEQVDEVSLDWLVDEMDRQTERLNAESRRLDQVGLGIANWEIEDAEVVEAWHEAQKIVIQDNTLVVKEDAGIWIGLPDEQ